LKAIESAAIRGNLRLVEGFWIRGHPRESASR
jgi:hypothetical protein